MSDAVESIESLAERLGRALTARKLTVSAAESCTGGLVAAAITAVPGSSGWFEHSVVTYSNDAKRTWVGVPSRLIQAHGAVSEATVAAMAQGVVQRLGADIGIAVSGIAGPEGGTPGKPVGTVWIAVARRDGDAQATRHHFAGERAAVRQAAVAAALHATLSLIENSR